MGEYRQGKPFFGERSWRRNDTYLPTGETVRLFVTGGDDHSPRWPYWESGKYDPECSCCWLGFWHSENYHLWNIGIKEAAEG